eukprot:scaffold125357_cov28-Tisochrysis_lutea.AAC.4
MPTRACLQASCDGAASARTARPGLVDVRQERELPPKRPLPPSEARASSVPSQPLGSGETGTGAVRRGADARAAEQSNKGPHPEVDNRPRRGSLSAPALPKSTCTNSASVVPVDGTLATSHAPALGPVRSLMPVGHVGVVAVTIEFPSRKIGHQSAGSLSASESAPGEGGSPGVGGRR